MGQINNNYERTKNLIQSIYLIKYAANVLITFLFNLINKLIG